MIGVAPPQIAQWDEAHVRGRLTTVDIVEAARAEIGGLRGRADLIVALVPFRRFPARFRAGARRTPGRTLPGSTASTPLFLGHQHLLFPGEDFVGVPGADAERGTLHGKPAVMAGFWGSHLGVIDL